MFRHNVKRKSQNLRFFEFGNCYDFDPEKKKRRKNRGRGRGKNNNNKKEA